MSAREMPLRWQTRAWRWLQLRRGALWNGLKIALALLLTGVVLTQTSVDALLGLAQRVAPGWVVLGGLCYGAILLLSARRYWLLIERGVPFATFFNLFILQNAITNFVASSAGAVSYVAMLRGEHQVRVSRSVGSVLLAKAGDGAMVALALLLTGALVWAQIGPLHGLVVGLLATSALGGLLVLGLWLYGATRGMPGWLQRRLDRPATQRIMTLPRVRALLVAAADLGSQALGPLTLPTLVSSALILLLTFAWAYCNMRAFGLQIELGPLLFVTALTQILSIVPVQVFGGLGVYDASLVYLYGLFGIGGPEFISAVIGIRLLFCALNLLCLAYVPVNTQLRRQSSPS